MKFLSLLPSNPLAISVTYGNVLLTIEKVELLGRRKLRLTVTLSSGKSEAVPGSESVELS